MNSSSVWSLAVKSNETTELISCRNETGEERHPELVLDGSQVIVKGFCLLLVYADMRNRVARCSGELSQV